jgi:hypothetical protein
MGTIETLFIAASIGAFVLFAAVVVWTDVTTRVVREGKK